MDITGEQGAGDGGGRLYWKHGEFIRSTGYRLDADGTLDVYEEVSDQSATSFLFHTNESKGASFTFSLRMPYSTASTAGYGLSDHFLLEHVANHRFDVKYGSRLLSLQLFPEQLRKFKERYNISYVKERGKQYLRLRRHKTMINSFYFTEDIYVNPTDWRFEKIILEDAQRWHRIEATKFQEVNGVTLPRTVRVSSPQFRRSLPYELAYSVRTGTDIQQSIKRPEWLDDPAVPEVSDVSTQEIHEQLEEDVSGEFYKKLMQAAIRYRYMLGPSHFHPQKFQTSIDVARKTFPNSRLLKAYKDGISSRTKISEDQMYITSFPTMKSYVVLPYMNYAAAHRARRAGYKKKAGKYLKPIRNKYPYDRILPRYEALQALRDVEKVEEFVDVLRQSYLDASVTHFSSMVPPVVRILRKQKEWVEEVETLVEQHSSPLLHLVLARYYQRQEQFSQANRHYGVLADQSYLTSNIRSYLRQAGFRAESLVERFRDEITQPGILFRLALKRFQSGSDGEAISIVHRVKTMLEHPAESVLGSLDGGDMNVDQVISVCTSLLRRLVENEERTLAREMTQNLIRLYHLSWDQRTDFIASLSSIFDGETEERFQMARSFVLAGSPGVVSEFMEPGDFRSHLLQSIEEADPPEDASPLALAHAVSLQLYEQPDQLRTCVQLLKQAKERFEETDTKTPYVLNAIGDAHLQLKAYGQAEDAYVQFLSLVRRKYKPSYYSRKFRSVAPERVISAFQGEFGEVSADAPAIVKLAYVMEQGGRSGNEIRRTISPYIRLHRFGLTPAMALLIGGRKKRARKHLLMRFQQTSEKQTGRKLMNVLVSSFKQQKRYAAAALIYNMAIRRLKIDSNDVKEKYRSVRQKINRQKMIDQLRNQDYGTPSPQTRTYVNRMIDDMKGAENPKQRMKLVSKIINSGQNVVPVLLDRLDTSSGTVRGLVRKMLETMRMRQIYRELFGFPSVRSRF